jgi:mono/diheme cytochrome c family protein
MQTSRSVGRALGALALICALATSAGAQDVSEETVDYFKTNCTSCHTIGGGKLAGPDLKGATERKDADWLATFIVNPQRVINSGDAYALELVREAKDQIMPAVPGLTKDRALKLVELIQVESAKEKSRFVGLQLSDRALTDEDVAYGRALYEGSAAFASGAPACLGCHEVDGTGGFGGGRLGPDLTDVYSRLEGRKPLAAWLAAPPSLTMQPVFADQPLDSDEVLALVAYLKSTAESGRPVPGRGPFAFLIAGIAGAVVVLVGFDLIWRRRFRGVRRRLVMESK